MARGSKKEASAAAATDPVAEERARLKGLAFSRTVLSQKPTRLGSSSALAPSKTVIKHHGKDILRKSQRKNRYLFSFPGLLGPISGGRIGDLKDLGTKNPVLYLDFPQGRMKLFGTIVYPKNRYLTLQFSKGGKSVTCDDYFDNMIVFSDAWWIGTKEENPEELRLQFPDELNMEKKEGYDFKGGIGSPCDGKQGIGRLTKKCVEQVSSEDNTTDYTSNDKELVELTPTRRSARTAGKTLKQAQAETSRHLAFEVDSMVNVGQNLVSGQCDWGGEAKDPPNNADTPLVQTTLSSLFKKVEEKKAKDLKQERNTSEVSNLSKKKIGERESVNQRKSKNKASSTISSSSKKGHRDLVLSSESSDTNDSTQVEDDDIEEFSSSSQDMDASDEDWAG